MSLTLGEKLRQAREERGLSISEVAEQTRISALYLESIENNDYRTLPGGIFNKGFVKSYAKHVGLNEQEALQDYAALLAEQGNTAPDDPQTYRPEVLTDDRSRTGLLPTILFSVIIVGLMVWGILAFLNYYNNPNKPTANTNTNSGTNSNTPATPTPTPVISTNEIKVEFKALNGPVYLSSTNDGKKASTLIPPDKPATFEPKQNLSLGYAKEQAANVQLTINGKQINLPTAPANPKRKVIELTISKENVGQILQSGAIASAPAAP